MGTKTPLLGAESSGYQT